MARPLKVFIVTAILFAVAEVMQIEQVSAQGFYQGKTLEIIVWSPAADSYDTLSRLVSRHIGHHLPGNPTVIVRNMPGAAGIIAANYLYNRANKDGTVIGMLEQSTQEMQLFHSGGLQADVTKLNWIGRLMSNNAVLFAWHTASVKRIEDSFTKELAVSVSGRSSQNRWTVLKKMFGLNFKLITGHRGATEASLAMERGEVDALSMPWAVLRVLKADWLRDGKINILLQTALERAPDLPNVPRVVDLARNDEQRQILELFSQSDKVGRSFTSPPDVPSERVEDLRAAFTATLKDPDFVAEAQTMGLSFDPLPGDELQASIGKILEYSPEIVKKAADLVMPN
jgi:tripartite-type tricarboxylate transporter receptor subunit TctC